MHDELSLDGISVSRNGRNLLENIRIDIIRGKKIAVTGPSGSGKSTLMKLLVSDDESIGRIDNIILDGKPVDAADISSLFAYSSQYPVVLADTLWFNLTLGRKIGKQRVMDVCKSLDLDDIVREKGFDYVLSADGTGLSGGQLARIELARAVLSERPILLLDDVLSELDRSRQNYLLDSISDIQTLITCTGLDDFISHQFQINKVFQVVQGNVLQPEQ